jgi:hypothetical protein
VPGDEVAPWSDAGRRAEQAAAPDPARMTASRDV